MKNRRWVAILLAFVCALVGAGVLLVVVRRQAPEADSPTPDLPRPSKPITLVPIAPLPDAVLAQDPASREPKRFNVHASGEDPQGCRGCHDSDSGPALLTDDVDALCRRCHEGEHGADSHPVGIPLSSGMKTRLPLSKLRIACHTCHDPHASSGDMLRQRGKDLCSDCHKGY